MYYRSVTVRVNEEDFTFTSDMITVKEYEKTVHVEEFIPSVIEPSFGVGRVMYSLFEVKNTTSTYYNLYVSSNVVHGYMYYVM